MSKNQPPEPTVSNLLIIQTAFLGDVVLTLPLVQEIKRQQPAWKIDVVTIPRSNDLLNNHPAIRRVIVFDKRGKDNGMTGLQLVAQKLKVWRYDIALIPHRSLRSALLARLAAIPRRIGFNTSGGRLLLTETIQYRKELHEVERNLEFLPPIGLTIPEKPLPRLFPSEIDQARVNHFLSSYADFPSKIVTIAPGSVWNTKRWLPERFIDLAKKVVQNGFGVVLIGGGEDEELGRSILDAVDSPRCVSAIGALTLLQSAELIRRSHVLVSNDSAPMHLAVAMQTPVVAIFGATVPSFGFAPYGVHDVVVETPGLECRPCNIHGGPHCPIKTFDCMTRIEADGVLKHVLKLADLR